MVYSLLSRLRQSRRHFGGVETEVVVMSGLKLGSTSGKTIAVCVGGRSD